MSLQNASAATIDQEPDEEDDDDDDDDDDREHGGRASSNVSLTAHHGCKRMPRPYVSINLSFI
jgi:hypothetical protein